MIKNSITEINDWPIKGVNFKDLTGILAKPKDFRWALDRFNMFMRIHDVDCIVAPEARGFIWGSPVAAELNLPFHIVRKPGKLPPPLIGEDYDYEYASGRLEMKGDVDIGSWAKVGIIDDVTASGGTALAMIQLLIKLGVDPKNIYYACVVDLKFLQGSDRIRETGVTMISLVTYDE
jgi:adenine phosphoribosyltransferase